MCIILRSFGKFDALILTKVEIFKNLLVLTSLKLTGGLSKI